MNIYNLPGGPKITNGALGLGPSVIQRTAPSCSGFEAIVGLNKCNLKVHYKCNWL